MADFVLWHAVSECHHDLLALIQYKLHCLASSVL